MLYAWHKSDTTDPEFVERRRAGLENFLLRVATHPHLCFDDQFINFLQQEHGWRETLTETGKHSLLLKIYCNLLFPIKFYSVKTFNSFLSTVQC